jgi:hypothetical protein
LHYPQHHQKKHDKNKKKERKNEAKRKKKEEKGINKKEERRTMKEDGRGEREENELTPNKPRQNKAHVRQDKTRHQIRQGKTRQDTRHNTRQDKDTRTSQDKTRQCCDFVKKENHSIGLSCPVIFFLDIIPLQQDYCCQNDTYPDASCFYRIVLRSLSHTSLLLSSPLSSNPNLF